MRRPKIKQPRKGAILSLMVMAVLLLSMTSLALIRLGTTARLRVVKSDAQIAARFAADAGVERAIHLMNRQLAAGTWTLDDVPTYTAESLPGSSADYTVTFTGDLAGGYQLTSVGRSGNHTKTIRATLALTSPIAKGFAVFGKDAVDLKNSSLVGGFNSGDSGDTDISAKVGTLSKNDGAINLDNNVTVNGDVYIASDGDPDEVVTAHIGATINGDTFMLPSYYSLPRVSPPGYVASQGAIAGKYVTLRSSDSGKYSKINITNNGILSVDGDVTLYITGDIKLKTDAKIEVGDHSTLTLYFNGDIDAQNASGFNNKNRIPANLLIYGTGSDQAIHLKNSSDLYGIIYAPNAKMVVHNSVDSYGSFIVEDFELKNSGEIYYDKALKQVSKNDTLSRFAIVRWEEL
ncbi:MAG: hypothetical protein ABFR90_03445 [Planctomycetota bacterium]